MDKQLAQGKYASFAEIVNVALAHLEADDEAWKRLPKKKLDRLRRQINVGLAELNRGEGTPFSVEEIKREGRRILAARRAKKTR